MTPQYAIRFVLSQYVGFSGRASRLEYWIWWGSMVAVFVAIGAVAVLFGSTGYVVASLFIPFIGGLILFVFMLLDSQSEPNKWGPPPYGSTYGPRTP